MLAVGIDLGRKVVGVALRVLVAGLDGTADAEVERVLDHGRAGPLGLLGGTVGRPVVDDQDVEVGALLVDRRHDARDGLLLVVGGDDRESVAEALRHGRFESHPWGQNT